MRHKHVKLAPAELTHIIDLLDSRASSFRGGCPSGELSVAILDDAALARLHGRHLDDPSITDVITFSGSPELGFAGEICVSADAARRQAPHTTAASLSRELALYVVHGWLHLAGFDDLNPTAKRAMRRAEARAMRLIEDANAMPKLRFSPR